MPISGLLQLGIGISGTTVITPPAGTNYAPQPIEFDLVSGGIALSSINCVFGPVSGSWDTLTVFGVTDASGNPLLAPGTLQVPFTPLNGQLVVVPPGNILLVVGAQFAAGPGAFISRSISGPTTSGSATLGSGAWTQLLPSGSYNTVTIQNLAQGDAVYLRVGDTVQPVTGSTPTAVIPPYGTWPPGESTFVPTGPIWATCAASGGTRAAFITG